MRPALLALALAVPLFAADPNVGAPVTGFVVTAGTVRPILGIPGAARLGNPVQPASAAITISSPAGLALECAEGELRRIDLNQATREIVTSMLACPDALAFSPAAESAVLVFRSQNAVRLLTKSGMSEPHDVTGVTACAVSDDAARLLCSTDSGLVGLTSAGASMRLLPDQAAPAAFLRGSREAIVAGNSRIYLLRNGWQLEPLAEFENASSVAILGDQETVVAASKLTGKIAAIRVRTRSVEMLDSPVQPEALVPLSPRVVQIATTAPGPTWLLVTAGNSTRFYFVPQPEAGNE
jgi:hypothetical protein